MGPQVLSNQAGMWSPLVAIGRLDNWLRLLFYRGWWISDGGSWWAGWLLQWMHLCSTRQPISESDQEARKMMEDAYINQIQKNAARHTSQTNHLRSYRDRAYLCQQRRNSAQCFLKSILCLARGVSQLQSLRGQKSIYVYIMYWLWYWLYRGDSSKLHVLHIRNCSRLLKSMCSMNLTSPGQISGMSKLHAAAAVVGAKIHNELLNPRNDFLLKSENMRKRKWDLQNTSTVNPSKCTSPASVHNSTTVVIQLWTLLLIYQRKIS